MENYEQFKDGFDTCFVTLKKLTEESFSLMEAHPEKRNEITGLWKNHIVRFISDTYKTSEKYSNKDVFKTITKALMFGK